MTKVMLINPPRREYDKSTGFNNYFPIGLLSIASVIRNICEVKILDCLLTDLKIEKHEEFILYGTSVEKIKEEIKNFNPDIVGISIPFTSQSINAIEICKICKEINKNIVVVFGGPDASVRYKILLKDTPCDFCVIGEGEKTFFEFVNNFKLKKELKNIEGVAYKEKNIIKYKPRKYIENLDELPIPAYDLIDMNAYLKNKYLYKYRSELKKSISIITSRGCPFNCIFCSIKLHMGKKYRANSPDYIIKHLEFLINNYNIRNFHFEDDNISLDKNRFEQILDKIIENKLKIRWDTPNGVRADTLDFELLKKIKKSGCKKLTIAIESGNQETLDKIIKKNTSLEYMIKIAIDCKKLKIPLNSFYLVGFPGESIERMKETIDLSLDLFKKYDVFPSLHIVTPLYGTELYDICIKNKLIKENLTDKDFAVGTQVYGEPLIATKDFSKEDIKNLTKNYISELKKLLIIYSIKHPIFAFKRGRDKISVITKFMLGSLVKEKD